MPARLPALARSRRAHCRSALTDPLWSNARVARGPVACLMLALAAGACGRSSPAGPTSSPPALSNPRVVSLGSMKAACGAAEEYMFLDRIEFDFAANGADVLGKTVWHRPDPVAAPGRVEALGNVQACPGDPCVPAGPDPPLVCLVSGSSTGAGTIRAHASTRWTPERTWRIHLAAHLAGNSNEIIATVARPEGYPHGDTAGFIRVSEPVPFPGPFPTVAFSCLVYDPGVEGRVLELQVSGRDARGRAMVPDVTRRDERRRSFGEGEPAYAFGAVLHVLGFQAPFSVEIRLRELDAAGVRFEDARSFLVQ